MKKFLILALLVVASLQLNATNVDMATAQKNAQRFLVSQSAKGRFMTSAPTIKWTHEVKSSTAIQAAYYIVNTDCGFVIVPGDDRARDVLAYGEYPIENLNDLPEAMQLFLDMFQKQMEYLQAHPGLNVQKAHLKRGVSVEPLFTTAWNQGKPYNMKTPRVGYGSDPYCKVGCSAVALAQVMKYWEYPTTSPALPGYTTKTHNYVMDPLPEYTFDWDNMLDSYKTNTDQYTQEQLDAISWFMRYVGQAETMDYATDQSGAERDQILDALRTFGYDDDARIVMKWDFDDGTVNYTEEGWGELIQSELRAGRPLVYCAFDMSSDSTAIGGHAFNVDGYDAENDLYHVNFGMSADKNTYYALNAFTLDNGMTVYDFYPILFAGVQPPGISTTPHIYVTPYELDMECYVGKTTTATFNVAGANLTDGITVTLNDENGVYTIDATAVTIEDATAGKTITVTYAPQAVGTHTATITLTSEDAVEKVVTLTGVATLEPLETYDPVMLPADSNYISLTSFRADWTDQTPAQNVASYTLEVSTKPNYNILAEADWSWVGQNYNNVSAQASQYFPEGWTFNGSGLWLEGGYISINSVSYFTTPTFETAAGKVTVVINANNNGSSSAKFAVSTSLGSQDIIPAATTTQYVVVLDCAASDQVKFTGKYSYPGFVSVKVYSGEIDPPAELRATETGDATYRLVTGITDKSYTVSGLTAEGTFLYKVKALYTDGTESAWSNIQEVTLFDNGPAPHDFDPGDVNHDGAVSIKDVTALIDYLLGSSSSICTICADVNGDENVTIKDVTALIDLLLGAN